MLRRLFALLLLAGCATTTTQPPLAQKIDALTAKLGHSLWGIDVEDEDGHRLYARNATQLFIPASNRKLFSGATAANCLGFERQLSTDVFLDGHDVVIRGGGDPSLGGRWTFDRDALFAPVVDALRARGIAAVGDIVADVSLFDRITTPPQWEIEDVGSSYATPVDALAYNENVVGIAADGCGHPVAADVAASLRADEAVAKPLRGDALQRRRRRRVRRRARGGAALSHDRGWDRSGGVPLRRRLGRLRHELRHARGRGEGAAVDERSGAARGVVADPRHAGRGRDAAPPPRRARAAPAWQDRDAHRRQRAQRHRHRHARRHALLHDFPEPSRVGRGHEGHRRDCPRDRRVLAISDWRLAIRVGGPNR